MRHFIESPRHISSCLCLSVKNPSLGSWRGIPSLTVNEDVTCWALPRTSGPRGSLRTRAVDFPAPQNETLPRFPPYHVLAPHKARCSVANSCINFVYTNTSPGEPSSRRCSGLMMYHLWNGTDTASENFRCHRNVYHQPS